MIYTILSSTKQNESHALGINMCTCKNTRQGELELHVQTKHSLFISGSMDMHESSKRAMGIKNECFYTDIFRFCSLKKMKDIQEPKPISTYPSPFMPEMQAIFVSVLRQ